MQKITLVGNLGRDPEERFTGTGKKVMTLSLAVQVSKDLTMWYELSIWEDKIPMFQGIIPHLKKGSRLFVIGDLMAPRCYLSKQGEPKVSLKVQPFSISFLPGGGKKEEEEERPHEARTPSVYSLPLDTVVPEEKNIPMWESEPIPF